MVSVTERGRKQKMSRGDTIPEPPVPRGRGVSVLSVVPHGVEMCLRRSLSLSPKSQAFRRTLEVVSGGMMMEMPSWF